MQLTLDSAHGELLKRQGQASVEMADLSFVETMRQHAREISDKSGFVTVENLRVLSDSLGLSPKHPNSWGSVFKGVHWKIVGRKKSAVPSSHHREIKIWRYE